MEKYYKLMSYDDLDYYYVFSDAQTYELLFLNSAFCNYLNIKLDSSIGKKCYEVIYNRSDVCPNCVNEELINSNFNSMEIVKDLNKKEINCNITIIKEDNKYIRMSRFPINTNKYERVDTLNVNDILADLNKNIKKNNFHVYLQPKFEILKNNNALEPKLVGAEALVRRYDENLNDVILPDEFISLYEHMSIIRHLDLHVLEKACQIADKVTISVNFSCATLLEFDCVSNIKSICDKYNVEYKNIMIEISKDKFLESHKNFIKITLNKLSNLGFLLSLSNIDISFPNLYSVPGVQFDEIKINKNIILDGNINYNSITKDMFKNNVETYRDTCDVVAVGVENNLHMDFFYDVDCNYQQGFLYSKPLPITDFFDKYIH